MAWLSFTEVGLLLLLVMALMLSAEAREKTPKVLRRKKREWIFPPAKLMENVDYREKKFIAKIRSDRDSDREVHYFLKGPGADKPPINLFLVDPDTGFVRITKVLDREDCQSYNLTGIAKYRDGTTAEDDIPLTVTVLDENDNPPRFEMHSGHIEEASKADTFVMQIEAKDDDQPGTINSEIAYSIISQEPAGTGHMFTIDRKTGKLSVKQATLDRETHDFYKLVVQGTDLGGAVGGLTGTGTVEIKVLDINDNRPVLEKSEYSVSVDENVADVVVMRIKALDKDLINTDNWLTVYSIASGNEDNVFSIETDNVTNEGILKLIKPVDFEELQKLELGLLIANVAPFVDGGAMYMDVDIKVGEGTPIAAGTGAEAGAGAGAGAEAGASASFGAGTGTSFGAGASFGAGTEAGAGAGGGAGAVAAAGVDVGVGIGLDAGLKPGVKPGPGTKPKPNAPTSYPIKIAVNNMPESPTFIPNTKIVPVSEDVNQAPDDGVITTFTATDPDTGEPAEDVSYAKAYDPDNWFTIDEETAEIKLNKAPDRESPFLVNGTYIAKILAITKDMPSKTATGTIAIKVTDFNDHCPTLTTTYSSLCSDEKTVHVTGFDEDAYPNAAPYTFRIVPEGTRGSWDVEVINATSAALHSLESLWPGSYQLQVEVLDAQGLSCETKEIFTVDVCTCAETKDCTLKTARLGTTSSELSAPAIGLLLMALCLLLLIPLLLLFCQCGGANTIFPDQFSDLPFDAKEHLISYHTEGRGEDKEVPLLSVPIMLGSQKKVEAVQTASFNANPSKITETHQQRSSYAETVQKIWETNQSSMETDNAYGFSTKSFNHGNGSASLNRQTSGGQHTTALYEDIALPDAFLHDYYSQKAACVVQVKDCLLEYDFEGQGSSAGSVGSLLGSDNDLQFLNDLGPKFKTLAEICCPPTPKPSLTHSITGAVKAHIVDIAEPVNMPKIDRIVETKHTDIKTEKVMSSTNISKSSDSTVSTAPASMTLPHSNVTNISHSSNISHSANLHHQAQTVILQQQPVYYTTGPVLQPVHYVVQPQLQNSVLLADGAHGANFPGLYVVSEPQSPSALIISRTQGSPSGLLLRGIESPTSPVRLASPVSPSLLLPGGPGVSQGSVLAEGWKMVGPNPDGSYMLVKDMGSPGEAKGVNPGTSQGTLPRDAILVKEAAPPQGVLGPAAQGSVYGILPGHTIAKKGDFVAVNSNLGKTWVGQPGQMGFGPGTVLGVGVGQPRMGMGHVVSMKPEVRQAGIWPTGINPVGIRQVSVNQFQGIPPLEQTEDTSGFLRACRIALPKKDKITITVETAKTHQHSKEEGMMKNQFQDDSNPGQNMHEDTVEERPEVVTYTSEHDTTLDDEKPCKLVQSAFEDNESIEEYPTQTSEKSSIVNFEGIAENPANTFTDAISQSTESNDSQHKAEEEKLELQKKHVPSEGFSKEGISMVIEMSTEALQSGSDVTDLVNTVKENEELSTFSQGEGATSTPDPINIVDDQIHDSTEENVGRHEAAPLKEEEVEEEGSSAQLSIVEGSEDRSADVGSEPQLSEVTEELSDRDLEEDIRPAENVERNQVIATSDSIQAEENMEEMTTVTSDSYEEVTAEQEQVLDPEVGVNSVVDKLSAAPPNEISTDTVNESEERSIPDQKAMPDLGNRIDEGHTKTAIANSEARTSLQTVSTILPNQEDLGDSNLILASAEMTTQVQAEGSSVPTISTSEQHLDIAKDISTGYREDDANQQHMMSESGVYKDQVNADADSISDVEKEKSILEEGVSQQSVSTPNEPQDEDTERQYALSSQMEDHFTSDDNITEDEDALGEMASPLQKNISFSDDQDEGSAEEDSSLTSFEVDGFLISDDNIQVPEEEDKETAEEMSLSIHQNVSITDHQDEDIKREAVLGSSLLEDQIITGDNMDIGEKEEHIVEEVASAMQPHLSISNDKDEEIGEVNAGSVIHQVENQFLSEDSIRDGPTEENIVEEESPVHQTAFISEENEESGKEDSHTVFQANDKIISDDSVSDGEKEAPSIQHNICISDAPGTSSHVEEEDIQSTQLLEEDSQPLETECLSEEDINLASQHAEMNPVAATSKVVVTQETPCEVTPHQGMSFSQTGDIILDIPERQETVGQALVTGANLEGLDTVVTSSEKLRSSRVATGQVFMSSQDKGASSGILASGRVAEGETNQYDYHNTDIDLIEQSKLGDLTLKEGKAEVTFDPEITEGLDHSATTASGQVSPTVYSQIKVVDKTISSVLEKDPGSSERGTACFIGTSDVAEDAGDLGQNERVHMIREAAGVCPNTVGRAGWTEVVSKASDYADGTEAGGGEVSPVQLQSVISQAPRNKSRKSKKDSNKSQNNPSGKCKQQ
ncbi:uncharacterized protein LOC116400073 [Anarrhichthys ocellatus]|uniref:uncharacterized protein LOC116400073 n=1 Tax=Anarrhichthys ocellatus TaxID=433405 RepID=UPI0012EDD02D|nr:uncharacterized protein LOC116400073 [Anarrhichthys ocellatus]